MPFDENARISRMKKANRKSNPSARVCEKDGNLRNLADRLQVGENFLGQRFGRFRAGIEDQFRLERSFIRIVDARETLQFPGASFFVQSLGIAGFANVERRIDENFDEIAGRQCGARMIAIDAIGADESSASNDAGVAEELRHRADAADVFLTVLRGETEAEPLGEFLAVAFLEHARPGVQAVADVVAVENEAPHTAGVKFVIDQIGDGAFSAGAQSGEPENAAGMAVEFFAFFARDGVFVPMHLNLILRHEILFWWGWKI
jgi:hypothetical protein